MRLVPAIDLWPAKACLQSQTGLAGRRDAAVADPLNRLPEETLSAEALRMSFESKGLSAQDLVALSGAHTVSP